MADPEPAQRTRGPWVAFLAGAAGPLVIAVVLIAILTRGGDTIRASAAPGPTPAAASATPTETDLKKAAAAAGCTLLSAPDEGAAHVLKKLTSADYHQNPPTGGPHSPQWYDDGIYGPGETPDLGKTVHPLEHGRIEIQYAPGTLKSTVKQLETLVKSLDGGYHMLLFQNGTGMPYVVAATAWDHSLGCPQMNAKVIAALRDFRTAYIDKGPEVVP